MPDRDESLRELPRLKEELNLNLKLAAPSDFIPVPDGWEERVGQAGLEPATDGL
jgi:hypothetical protein